MKKKSIIELAEEFAKGRADLKEAFLAGYSAALQREMKPPKKGLDLSFVCPAFQEVVQRWFDYKKEKKSAYTQRGAESLYKKLFAMSGGNPRIADAIIEQSIANNWQGLFELKQNGIPSLTETPRIQQRSGIVTNARQSVERMADLAEAALCSLGGYHPEGNDFGHHANIGMY